MRSILAALVVVLAGAVASSAERAAPAAETVPPRWYNDAHVAHGAKVFAERCAGCHGARGEGADHWRRRDARGNFPPPPLNGSGHAWHHPSAVLLEMILNGIPGGGGMPAWAGVISANDAAAVIAWFQSQWPDEIYAAWYRVEMRTREHN